MSTNKEKPVEMEISEASDGSAVIDLPENFLPDDTEQASEASSTD